MKKYIFRDIINEKTSGTIFSAKKGKGTFENNSFSISDGIKHFIYKFDQTLKGWYRKNEITGDEVYIGEGAYPVLILENVSIFNQDYFDKIAVLEEEKRNGNTYSQEESLYAFAKWYLTEIGNNNLRDEEKIKFSGLYQIWTAGKYEVGDIRNHAGQTWECWTAHDNAIYPDITPDNPQTWANFWRPLHGKSPETARPWVKPQYGTTDMYHAGEYMVYTDGNTYECVSDTVYSPDEYAQAWRVVGEASEPDGGEGGEIDGEEDVQEPSTEEYPAWVQPTGAHDAYAQGAKVSHNGKKWVSTVSGNVWAPGVYGWEEVA